jgi:hypothetical protein
MSRLALLVGFLLLALGASARAADLPTGTWSVNVNGTKGELVIAEVGKDGKVKAKLLGTDVTGTWKGGVLRLNETAGVLEGRLVSEPGEKGKTKYTLTGTRTQVTLYPVGPDEYESRTGWYAKIVTDNPAPVAEIKVEVKGKIVCKDTTEAYVLVYRDEGFGLEEEIRIYFRLSEGEWKYWKDVLPKLNGKAVTVTGSLGQIPKRIKSSVPEGALYFESGFVIKTATETFK